MRVSLLTDGNSKRRKCNPRRHKAAALCTGGAGLMLAANVLFMKGFDFPPESIALLASSNINFFNGENGVIPAVNQTEMALAVLQQQVHDVRAREDIMRQILTNQETQANMLRSLQSDIENLVLVGTHGQDHWTAEPSLMQRRAYVGAAAFQNKLYAVGGCYGHDSVEYYDGTSWHSAPSGGLSGYTEVAVAVFQGKLYAVGGQPVRSARTVTRFDGSSWESAPSLTTARVEAAAIAFQDMLYAIAGTSTPSSVERFDGTSWSSVASMSARRGCQPGVAVFHQRLYVFGGYDTAYMASVEYFDGASWHPGPSMISPRYRLNAAVLNNKVYVIGGQGDGGALSSVEAFDGIYWQASLPMTAGRRSNAAAVFMGKIYAIGGYTNGASDALSSVEAFVPALDEFRALTHLRNSSETA